MRLTHKAIANGANLATQGLHRHFRVGVGDSPQVRTAAKRASGEGSSYVSEGCWIGKRAAVGSGGERVQYAGVGRYRRHACGD